MLTFFEYLRQRAFESVIAGVEDAYTYLDSHKGFESGNLATPTGRDAEPKQIAEDSVESPPGRNPAADGKAANEMQALPPRKRGRPKKNGSK